MHNGWMYVEIRKGMYGLPQAGLSVQELLKARLTVHGYTQDKLTPGLWKHHTRLIQVCFVVKNFGVKCNRREHAEHLKAS